VTLLLLAMAGAAVGAPSRWLLDQYVQARHRSDFPWGTLAINVVGSFLLGLLLAAASLDRVGVTLIALAGAGFCGGFTTFSTFGYETVRLAQEGTTLRSAANVALSLALGLAASVAGWALVTIMAG
jgi:fluoride exporter